MREIIEEAQRMNSAILSEMFYALAHRKAGPSRLRHWAERFRALAAFLEEKAEQCSQSDKP